ncbi:MAG: hypothetical protein ACLGP3_04795 [Acidobacteriota bacterium]
MISYTEPGGIPGWGQLEPPPGNAGDSRKSIAIRIASVMLLHIFAFTGTFNPVHAEVAISG